MESITEKEKRLDKMSATFEELKDGILGLKNVKSEYSQAAIILLRNVFTEREQKQSEQQSNCDLPHVSSSLRERELNKYLEEINTLMWNTWGVKHNKFDKEEGSKIMSILNRWANNDC